MRTNLHREGTSLRRKYVLSFSTGCIPFTNSISSARYFQPDDALFVPIHSHRHFNHTPQFLLPPLTLEGFEESLSKVPLSLAGKRRAAFLRRAIRAHPESFSRQIVTAYSSLYNEIYPPSLRQITIDYELFAPLFLADILDDRSSATHRLFASQEGVDFLLSEFSDVNTAWKRGETPFHVLKRETDKPPQFEPYRGDLSPDILSRKLREGVISPKSALNYLVFLLETGLAPVGGMQQTLYATQIKERVLTWLKQQSPDDPRLNLFANIPTDRAFLSPLWGVCAQEIGAPVTYKTALDGWKLDRNTARKIMAVSGLAALKAGALILNNNLCPEATIDDATKCELMAYIAQHNNLVRIPPHQKTRSVSPLSASRNAAIETEIDACVKRVLEKRPTLKSLGEAPSLGTYLKPVLTWPFRPDVFPFAKLFLNYAHNEIVACYGPLVAKEVKKQLLRNFSVETGVHTSLPRTLDRIAKPLSPASNNSTLSFQAILLSAAAQLTTPLVPAPRGERRQKYRASCYSKFP